MADLISRAAAIAEIEEYIEEYSELEPETGYHNLKWCAMEEAKDVLSMLPTIDAIPVEWLEDKELDYRTTGDKMFSDAFAVVIGEWQKKQEAQDRKRDYEAAVEMAEYCERYESTYNPEDGSM